MTDGGLFLKESYVSLGIAIIRPNIMVALNGPTLENLKIKFQSFGLGEFTTVNKVKLQNKFPGIRFDINQVSDDEFNNMAKWCNEKFGDNWIWSQLFDYFDFFFVNEEDCLLFTLTFGGMTFKNQSKPIDAIA